MIFSELLDLIRHETNLSDNKLANEIGITYATFRNIFYGKVIKPDGLTCKKIIDFCKKNDIETGDLDWNEILYESFQNSRMFKEYQWEEDIDDEGFVKLKHKKCSRSTYVPISAFDGKSTLCIHCWIEKYILSGYYYKELDGTRDYEFTHISCGRKYRVSYEQIKQGKYACPTCFPYSDNANEPVYADRKDYAFIRYNDLPHSWMNLDLIYKYVIYSTRNLKIAWSIFKPEEYLLSNFTIGLFAGEIDKNKVVDSTTYIAPFDFKGYEKYLQKYGIKNECIPEDEQIKYLLFAIVKTRDNITYSTLVSPYAAGTNDNAFNDSRALKISFEAGNRDILIENIRNNVYYFTNLVDDIDLSNEDSINDSILIAESSYNLYSFLNYIMNTGNDGLFFLLFSREIKEKMRTTTNTLNFLRKLKNRYK